MDRMGRKDAILTIRCLSSFLYDFNQLKHHRRTPRSDDEKADKDLRRFLHLATILDIGRPATVSAACRPGRRARPPRGARAAPSATCYSRLLSSDPLVTRTP